MIFSKEMLGKTLITKDGEKGKIVAFDGEGAFCCHYAIEVDPEITNRLCFPYNQNRTLANIDTIEFEYAHWVCDDDIEEIIGVFDISQDQEPAIKKYEIIVEGWDNTFSSLTITNIDIKKTAKEFHEAMNNGNKMIIIEHDRGFSVFDKEDIKRVEFLEVQ